MTGDDARRVVRTDGDFLPFTRYGAVIPGMTWLPLSHDQRTGQGSFLLRMAPGARSRPHEHTDVEEFVVLEGELVDNDGRVMMAGDFVSNAAGTRHFSTAPKGCLLAVFMRAHNRPLDGDEIARLPGPT
ncbi:MAG: cupin domain-containing protein [Alphaproteobacteria bacterium]|nr:cupin domain-containing protein [Alphaproteobacteria bacterium]